MAVVDWPTFTKNLTEMFDAAKKSKIDQKDSKTGVFHCSNGHKEECFIPDYIPQACFQIAAFIQALIDGDIDVGDGCWRSNVLVTSLRCS